MEIGINGDLGHEDELKDPLFDHPCEKTGLMKDTDGYDSDEETIAGKLFFPLNLIATKFKAGSMKGSIFTLMTATIGTGILLIPNSIAQSGLAWGIIQMLFCGWLGFYSLMLVIRSSEKAKVYSYQELAQLTFGHGLRKFVNVVFFFANWGTAIAYLVLVSQLIARVFGIFFGQNILPDWMTDTKSPWWPVIVATVFVLPLSLAKELKSLRYFCLLSFLFILFLAGVVIFEAFNFTDFKSNWKSINNFEIKGTSTTFSTAVFAYLSHPNVLDVFKELHNSTKRRMRKIIFRTTILVFVTYALVGSFGYITFAKTVSILSNKDLANGIILFGYGYDAQGNPQPYPVIIVIAILLIGLSVIVATPLCIKPAKDGLSDFFFPKSKPNQEDPFWRHTILVIITIYTGVVIGIVSSSMQDIINILGSSFFTMICFILPPMFYIKLSPRSKLWGHKIICWTMLAVFSVFTIWSTRKSIIEAINKH